MRKLLIISFLIIFGFALNAQELKNQRTKQFIFGQDSLKIDSLSIVPGSLFITTNKKLYIPDSLYTVNYPEAIIIFSGKTNGKNSIIQPGALISINYRVFPFNFTKEHFKRDTSIIVPDIFDARKLARLRYRPQKEKDFFSQDNLNKRGSISRGISVGNTQDVSVNSNLNLQLSGRINNKFEIRAAISDNNIPIQPEGNSQNIREFDKVYINMFNNKTSVIAGDFEIEKPAGYFMNMYKKVQGGKFSSSFDLNEEKNISLKTKISAAVSKGKYNRMLFIGQEGSQGPYKLFGAENEKYIIILAGTEKIFIDGKLLIRGQDQDYIIDYNTAEIIFTPKQPISKDKRIIVEFEYSDKNYARFLLFNSTEIQTKKSSFYLNIFSESDAKNQPINQNLDENRKSILAGIGDNLEQGIFSNTDSITFSTDFVLYKMIDTTINNIEYDSIFVYSNNPDSAFYRLNFSIVGNNKGNYILDKNAANGSVYKWIEPINGNPQGNYEPVVSLVSPKKNQMIVAGGESFIGKNSRAGFELAYSYNDLNTFSQVDDEDNKAYAAKLFLENNTPLKFTENLNFSGIFNYRLISADFKPIERIRSVEFERDWNINNNELANNEHLINTLVSLKENDQRFAILTVNYLNRGKEYNGINNTFKAAYIKKGFDLSVDASLLNSDDILNKTNFLRHKASLAKTFSFFKLGLSEESERNRWNTTESDSLLLNSFAFKQWEIFFTNSDSSKNNFRGSYKKRTDYSPENNELIIASVGEDLNFGINLIKNSNHSLKSSFNYRRLEIKKSPINNQKDENTLTARIEYFMKLFKGSITSSTFFETGSGLKYKKEYSYIEVAPGQGIYTWSDYNNNGIKELDEFELAKFKDQASWIRIFKPGQETVKVYNNQFNQLINIRPAVIWRKKQGVRQFLSKFSNNFAYKIDRNTLQESFVKSLNPFNQNFNDTSLISLNSSLRNTLSFNRSNTKFGIDIIIQDNRNRILLVNGLDTRSNLLKGSRLRFKLGENFNINNNSDFGSKYYQSEYFASRNYQIDFFRNEFILSYQAGLDFRLGLSYNYSDKKNSLDYEKALQHTLGSEIIFSKAKKANISCRLNYIRINYDGAVNTSLSYTMLEGLMPGNNATCELLFQKSLSEVLILNINYFGRVSQGGNIIHTGNITLRASF
ncbi:hypothetical protein ACFLSI_05295 [Bacteroidota bacterium]